MKAITLPMRPYENLHIYVGDDGLMRAEQAPEKEYFIVVDGALRVNNAAKDIVKVETIDGETVYSWTDSDGKEPEFCKVEFVKPPRLYTDPLAAKSGVSE